MVALGSSPMPLPCGSGSDLLHFRSAVDAARAGLLAHLGSLPLSFGELAVKHYLDRAKRATSGQMLGEYAPFCIAEIFGLPTQAAREMATPWLVLYEYALILDDALDVRDSAWPEQVVLSQVLLYDFLGLWADQCGLDPRLWQNLRRYHLQALTAIIQEARTGAMTGGLSAMDFECGLTHWRHVAMGRKAALVKFCGASLSLAHRGRLLSLQEEAGFDRLCAGIQVLDDLADISEDSSHGTCTTPLLSALNWLGHNYSSRLVSSVECSRDRIVGALLLSGVTNRLLDVVIRYLARGLSDLNVRPSSVTGRYISLVIERCRSALGAFERLTRDNRLIIDRLSDSLRASEDAFASLLRDPTYASVWADMRRTYESIPKASN